MKLVLLSGGSGKRLWPLSNDVRSKQFLRVLQNEQGDMVSMLERVWSQLADLDAQDNAYVCASHAQTDIIYSQLGDVSVIVEPMRMDTFPAIALATLYLSQDTLVDEVVAVAPVDQYVDKAFFKAILDLPRTLDDSGADLALLGVRPLCPSSQFGYIRVEQAGGHAPYRRVDSFTEKPNRDRAAQMVAEGALWNCGVFCFRASYLINLLRERGYPTTYRNMVEQFDRMPLRSFDYEVLESSESIVVTPYDGAWKDMGTWPVLAPELKNDFIGRGVAERCEDSQVINELKIPIMAVGLRNMIVAASPDGILVADKEHAGDIKGLVAQFAGRPMFEERRWGYYRVLDHCTLADGSEALTRHCTLRTGANMSYQQHLLREEVWTVIHGRGVLALDGALVKVAAGDVIRVCPGQWHALMAEEDLAIIEVQRGSELTEADCTRRFQEWDDILECCYNVVEK